ncbi:unnamed protein product [Prunus armeniaca]
MHGLKTASQIDPTKRYKPQLVGPNGKLDTSLAVNSQDWLQQQQAHHGPPTERMHVVLYLPKQEAKHNSKIVENLNQRTRKDSLAERKVPRRNKNWHAKSLTNSKPAHESAKCSLPKLTKNYKLSCLHREPNQRYLLSKSHEA